MFSECSAADLLNWSLSSSRYGRTIMSFLLFVLEVVLVVGGIALVPARSELRICRPREIYNERERKNSARS